MRYDFYTAYNVDIPHVGIYAGDNVTNLVATFLITEFLSVKQAEELAGLVISHLNSGNGDGR